MLDTCNDLLDASSLIISPYSWHFLVVIFRTLDMLNSERDGNLWMNELVIIGHLPSLVYFLP